MCIEKYYAQIHKTRDWGNYKQYIIYQGVYTCDVIEEEVSHYKDLHIQIKTNYGHVIDEINTRIDNQLDEEAYIKKVFIKSLLGIL